jgi:hypothetical protein
MGVIFVNKKFTNYNLITFDLSKVTELPENAWFQELKGELENLYYFDFGEYYGCNFLIYGV